MSGPKVDVLAVLDNLICGAKVGGHELRMTRAAVAELIVDMRRIKAAAALGIRYHATGPGYTEEITRIADAALSNITGATK